MCVLMKLCVSPCRRPRGARRCSDTSLFCPHTIIIYVSSYYYAYILIPQSIRPQTTACVLCTSICVSSYHYICPQTTICVFSYHYKCSHTTIWVPSCTKATARPSVVCSYMYRCYIHIHLHILLHLDLHIHIHTYVCMYKCVRVFVCVCI
jgi:hypothetical protein